MSTRKTTFAEFYYGLRAPCTPEEIIRLVRSSRRYTQDETTEDARALLLFEVGVRASWLVSTNLRLYKLMDDRREATPIVNWSVSLDQARESGVRVICQRLLKSGKFLKIEFGFREGKYYLVDPKLFQPMGVEKSIATFIGLKEFKHNSE
jgi:hypothetical protein